MRQPSHWSDILSWTETFEGHFLLASIPEYFDNIYLLFGMCHVLYTRISRLKCLCCYVYICLDEKLVENILQEHLLTGTIPAFQWDGFCTFACWQQLPGMAPCLQLCNDRSGTYFTLADPYLLWDNSTGAIIYLAG